MSILKRAIPLLFCVVMLAFVLVACDTDSSEETPSGTTPHTHIPATAVQENYVDSTCTQAGSYDEVVYCSACEEEISRTPKTVDKKAHDFNQKAIASTYLKDEATCTESAVYFYSCACGEKGTTTFTAGEPNGHTYGTWIEEVPATCDGEGALGHYHCGACGKDFDTNKNVLTSLVISANGHNYGTWINEIPATCEAEGTLGHYHCDACGKDFDADKSILNSLVISAHGHDHESVVTAPTCTAKGYTTYTCHCGDTYTANEVAANGHSYDEWIVTKEPTETAKGEKRRDCKNCDHYETEAIAELAHDHSRHGVTVLDAVAPTCTATGLTEGKKCSGCGETLVAQQTVPANGHSYGEWTQTLAPTCTEKGSERRDCEHCDHYETNEIKANGHTNKDAVVENQMDATCTADGSYNSVVYCSVCNAEVSREAKTIGMLGHDYSTEWTIDLEPTCTEKGSKSHHCSRCSDQADVTEIAANGHDYEAVVTEPTCTAKGYTTYTCHCGNTYTDNEVPATGHSYFTAWEQDNTHHWHKASCEHAEEISEKIKHNYGLDDFCDSCGHGREIYVTEITISPSVLTTYVGSTQDLIASILPTNASNKVVTWSSSDENVVTVVDGKITAIGIGTATITATTSNGKTATCEVTVAEALVFELTNDDSFYKVTGYRGNAKEYVIPEIYDGLRVIEISANAFKNNVTMESITIPSNVQTIGVSAFEGCINLKTIDLPESVTQIESRTFYGCIALQSIEIHSKITSIGEYAFAGCTKLASVNKAAGATIIGDYAFYQCTGLLTVNIEAGASTIGNHTFAECTSLKTVTIGQNVISIGEYAFAECSSLENVTLNDGLETIGKFAFDYCTSLKAIVLPDTVATVGNGAFRHAEAMERVTLSSRMTAISNITFQYCKSLKAVILHERITSIGNSAFSYCYGLEKLHILGDVNSFGDSAFYHCEALKEIYFASTTVLNLGANHYAFCRAGLSGTGITLTIALDAYVPEGLFEPVEEANRIKITAIVFEEGTEKVEYFAGYSGFKYLQSVTIPYGVAYVPANAFYDCTNLVVVMENENYTFQGWYESEGFAGNSVNLNGDVSSGYLYAKWKGNVQDLTMNQNLAAAGNVSTDMDAEYGETVTITATTNNGYTFVGWYEGETLLTTDASYFYTVWGSKTFIAKWEINVATEQNLNAAGNVTGADHFAKDESATVTATTNVGYTFVGWFNGDELLSSDASYTFVVDTPVTLTAKWNINVFTDKNIDVAGSVKGADDYAQGTNATVTATTNEGYTFVGWYNGDELLSTDASYTFAVDTTITLTAKWNVNVSTDKNIDAAGSVKGADDYAQGTNATVTATTNEGYTFAGWYIGNEKVSDETTYTFVVMNPTTVTAKWTINVSTSVNLEVAGTSAGDGTFEYGSTVTVTATTNSGYTFVGWYNGDELLSTNASYAFAINAPITLTAKFEIDVTASNNIEAAGSVAGTGHYAQGANATVIANTNEGYTFVGWYNGSELLSTNASYTFVVDTPITLTANWNVRVSTDKNIDVAGSVSGADDYTQGTNATVTATTNAGYTFAGWYIGDEKVSDETTYTFAVMNPITMTAKWTVNVMTNVNNDAAGTSTGDGTFEYGSTITVTATTKLGYVFNGWYNGEELLSTDLSYAFIVTSPIALTAVWEADPLLADFDFIITESTLTITGVKDKTKTSYDLPDGTTHIADSAFSGCTNLTSITIPESVVSIGSNAFYDCCALVEIISNNIDAWFAISFGNDYSHPNYYGTLYILGENGENVTTFVIPEGTTQIGACTFKNYTTLTTITIPSSVMNIGEDAFFGCTALTSVTIRDLDAWFAISFGNDYSHPNYYGTLHVIDNNGEEVTTLAIPDGTMQICAYMLQNYSALTTLTIPTTVTNIGAFAFSNCLKLENVVVPNSVTSIGNYAFYGCRNLESITLPFVGASKNGSTNTHFGYIFGAASETDHDTHIPASLKAVIITNGSICDYAFYNCSNLTSIIIPNNVTYIGAYAFSGCRSLMLITIPESVLRVGAYAFLCCENLTNITIPRDVTSIGPSAFEGCSALESLTLPFVGGWADGSIQTSYFGYIFGASSCYYNRNCVPSSLKTVVITGGAYIASEAFRGCSSLTNITLPENITSIGEYAFAFCEGLTSITIPNSVTAINEGAFTNCDSLNNVGFVENSKLKRIGEDAFYNCSSLAGISIPDSVTQIGKNAFAGCKNLIQKENGVSYVDRWAIDYNGSNTSIVWRDGTVGIGDYAFEDCRILLSITIPDSVIIIGKYAFAYCSSLTNVEFAEHSKLKSIGFSAFRGCRRLVRLDTPDSVTRIENCAFYNCSSLASVTIPDSVTSIYYQAFYGCSGLTSITIPDSVTSIDSSAFSDCSSLTSVYYAGTAEDWSKIIIDSSGNSYLTSATRYYYSETQPTTTGNYWHYVEGVPTKW